MTKRRREPSISLELNRYEAAVICAFLITTRNRLDFDETPPDMIHILDDQIARLNFQLRVRADAA